MNLRRVPQPVDLSPNCTHVIESTKKMIPITRGEEPAVLSAVRAQQLAFLRGLGRPPISKEIEGYRVVADDLWKAQYFKCCYCEQKVKRGFNDVEHFRPKSSADRRPGCTETHGYWWLAFTWNNLLFACPTCNRSGKNDRFPCAVGGATLHPEEESLGNERPLLLDPASSPNPVGLIQFVFEPLCKGGARHWYARPRTGTLRAAITIETVKLNSQELLELRDDYVRRTVDDFVTDLQDSIRTAAGARIRSAHARALRLLKPGNEYVGLAYDALRSAVPDAVLLSSIGKPWPAPDSVGT
jgi:uncharacterized protein (TIGR02646 family)